MPFLKNDDHFISWPTIDVSHRSWINIFPDKASMFIRVSRIKRNLFTWSIFALHHFSQAVWKGFPPATWSDDLGMFDHSPPSKVFMYKDGEVETRCWDLYETWNWDIWLFTSSSLLIASKTTSAILARTGLASSLANCFRDNIIIVYFSQEDRTTWMRFVLLFLKTEWEEEKFSPSQRIILDLGL